MQRFSLLLLDEGESYVQDWLSFCTPPAGKLDTPGGSRLRGRLRLCSSSLFFDADEHSFPVLRFPLSRVSSVEADGPAAVVTTASWVRQREGGRDVPYVTDRSGTCAFRFTLAYAPLHQLLVPLTQLLAIARLPHWERLAALREGAARREAAAPLDASRFAALSERSLFSSPAAQVALLLREPGRVGVTHRAVYFQPLHNVGADTPLRSVALRSLIAVARRRHAGAPTALELFWGGADGGGGGWEGGAASPHRPAPSVLLVFPTPRERDDCARVIRSQLPPGCDCELASAALEGDAAWVARCCAAWRAGSLSNASYLLYLNLAAGRSFSDAAAWPVFPWVLRDYGDAAPRLDAPAAFRDLAKPVGALNAQRLASCRERWRELASLGEAPFLWGTFYSTPGYVLFWLLRSLPAHALRLQGGRFDAPDRLFCSVAEAWASATGEGPDVKELTPEFYGSDASWLLNSAALPLGTRTNGTAVGDVALPGWAAGPDHFLAVQRAALEAPPVSASLHAWIDLIFGYKQRGAAADGADNVFHPSSFGDGDDAHHRHAKAKASPPLTGADAAAAAAAKAAHLAEFGVVPSQLFTSPHPLRFVAPPSPWPQPGDTADGAAAATDVPSLIRLVLRVAAPAPPAGKAAAASAAPASPVSPPRPPAPRSPPPAPPPPRVGAVVVSPLSSVDAPPSPPGVPPRVSVPAHRLGGVALSARPGCVASVGGDAVLRCWCPNDGSPLAGARLGRAPLLCVALSPPAAAARDALALAGGGDGRVGGLSPSCGRVLPCWDAHDTRVTALCLLHPGPWGDAATAAADGGVRTWRLERAGGGDAPAPCLSLPASDAAVTSLVASPDGNCPWLVVSGDGSGRVAGWDMRTRCASPAWDRPTAGAGARITQLSLLPGCEGVVASCSGGWLRLLDIRAGGVQHRDAAANIGRGRPVGCCAAWRGHVLGGTDAGEVVVWDAGAAGRAAHPLRRPAAGGAAPLVGMAVALASSEGGDDEGETLVTLDSAGVLRSWAWPKE